MIKYPTEVKEGNPHNASCRMIDLTNAIGTLTPRKFFQYLREGFIPCRRFEQVYDPESSDKGTVTAFDYVVTFSTEAIIVAGNSDPVYLLQMDEQYISEDLDTPYHT